MSRNKENLKEWHFVFIWWFWRVLVHAREILILMKIKVWNNHIFSLFLRGFASFFYLLCKTDCLIRKYRSISIALVFLVQCLYVVEGFEGKIEPCQPRGRNISTTGSRGLMRFQLLDLLSFIKLIIILSCRLCIFFSKWTRDWNN